MTRILVDMRRIIAPHIVERGLDYYNQGLVESVKVEGSRAHALVLGNYGDYKVIVNMENVEDSDCDCPYDHYCKHIAAVCFYLAQESGETESSPPAVHMEELSDLFGMLECLTREDLLDVLSRLIDDNRKYVDAVKSVLDEREKVAQLQESRKYGLSRSLKYYDRLVPIVLKECEGLFVRAISNDDEWEEGHGYDDEDMEVWDFSAGFMRLNRFGKDLLAMVTPEYYISGTVGLLVGVLGLQEWRDKYFSEYNDEMDEGCDDFEFYLSEALDRVKEYARREAEARAFLQELVEWMIGQCKGLEELTDWTWLLKECVFDLKGVRRLEETITRLDKNFIYSDNLSERERNLLLSWWVSLCLELDREEEALAAVENTIGDDSISRLFIRYYQGKERWQEAMELLGRIMEQSAGVADYRMMVGLCQKSADEHGEKQWLERWFLAFPEFELFKSYFTLCGEDGARETLEEWFPGLEEKKCYELMMQILLFLGETDRAWNVFARHTQNSEHTSPLILKLFAAMKKLDPARLIPHYKLLINDNIARRNRNAYALAARWLKELRDTWTLLGEEREWIAFYHKLIKEHKRFRALMEEIRRELGDNGELLGNGDSPQRITF